jgi:hypothetical protein
MDGVQCRVVAVFRRQVCSAVGNVFIQRNRAAAPSVTYLGRG